MVRSNTTFETPTVRITVYLTQPRTLATRLLNVPFSPYNIGTCGPITPLVLRIQIVSRQSAAISP